LFHDDQENVYAEHTAVGVAVVSQSCDIIRAIATHPYIQVAALVSVQDPAEMREIMAGRKPRYGYLASLAADGLAIDFDVVASVRKETVARWPRSPGCETSAEQRAFSQALARHRRRYAFPDNFNEAMGPLRKFIKRREGKNSAAGRFVDAISQIRVGSNDWANPLIIDLVCIMSEPPSLDQLEDWKQPMDEMLKTFSAVYPGSTIQASHPDEMSASEYLGLIRLDLDGLSDA
jgi:hypothetical protein